MLGIIIVCVQLTVLSKCWLYQDAVTEHLAQRKSKILRFLGWVSLAGVVHQTYTSVSMYYLAFVIFTTRIVCDPELKALHLVLLHKLQHILTDMVR